MNWQEWLFALGAIALWLFLSWMYGRWPFITKEEAVARAEVADLPEAPGFQSTDRVLFFSPHPDDESLGTGGSIASAVAAGAEVHICWMCAGDGYLIDAMLLRLQGEIPAVPSPEACLDLGRLRLKEALAAGEMLRVPRNHLVLMGYADATLLNMFIHPESVATSTYTKKSKGPYAHTVSFNEDYTGANAERHVRDLIDSVDPTIVYATAPLDTDADHQGTAFFVIKALESAGKLPLLRGVVIHGGDYLVPEITEYPIPRGLHAEMALNPPPIAKGYRWTRTSLSTQAVGLKYDAVKCHASQVDIMQGYMQSFVRTNELFATLTPEQAAPPKQTGTR